MMHVRDAGADVPAGAYADALADAPAPAQAAAVAAAIPPERERLMTLINAGWSTQVIAAAVELGLPGAMAAGARSLQALSSASATHSPSLMRLLRAMASLKLCTQDGQGGFYLTPAGALLQPGVSGSLNAWAALSGGQLWAQWGRLAESVRTGLSIRKLTSAHDDFSHLDSAAPAAGLFNRAMMELTTGVADAVAGALEMHAVRQVVDVGGGWGQLLCRVLVAHPQVLGVLFDMAHATQDIPEHFHAAGVAGRCTVVAGSFFGAVPAGADLYLLKSILHDWDDERCTAILRSCRRAMPSGARMAVIERLATEHAGASPHDRTVARGDLTMMVANGGCERTLTSYSALFAAAGLKLERVLPLAGGFSVMQLAPAQVRTFRASGPP